MTLNAVRLLTPADLLGFSCTIISGVYRVSPKTHRVQKHPVRKGQRAKMARLLQE